ncbi:hypothetical protein [Methylocapsa sp. S129]|uniref:hypothetical protein n=1 Tax=Methylocapsa sp. S129 TaxID=1641869 RepID=UPI00131B9B09|nr:hypothetical protein [Methylocapsa sp. S129]
MDSEPTCLVEISGRGIARLGDATYWRIAPGHLPRVTGWKLGVGIVVEENDHLFWKHRLLNLETGEQAFAVISHRRGSPLPRAPNVFGLAPIGHRARGDVGGLADRLAQPLQNEVGAYLSAEDVHLALAVLRVHVGMAGSSESSPAAPMYEIEIINGQGRSEEVLATARDEPIARAAFDEAVGIHPGRKLRMIRGSQVVAELE